jgi:AcrR family transcriptional regulator
MQTHFDLLWSRSKLVSTCCNAHFRDRKHVLEALLERALQRTTSALASAGPDTGAAPQALERLIAASWQQLARNDAIARAATELSPDAIRQAHQTARNVDHALLERGRHEGTFRTDLPPEWLLTALQGLIHAAAEAVRTGELEPDQTLDSLATSTHELWAGPERRSGS